MTAKPNCFRTAFLKGHSAVLDVTKPPFNAVPDGKTDCTGALRLAFDFVTGEYLKAFRQTKQLLQQQTDPNALLSFEVRKVGGKLNVPFPLELPKGYIIYLPKGVYRVTDTVTYSHEDLYDILLNLRWLEMCAMLRVVGEEQGQTVIRLDDGLPAFAFGARRPVLNFCNGEKSGVAMSNSVQNLTVDVGKNNPGAVALRFLCNNTGLVQRVTLKSSDPDFRGYCGFEMVDEKTSCGYVRHLTVEGFDYAVRFTSQQHNLAMEQICIKNQRIAGIYQLGSALSVRGLKSVNTVPAVHLPGYSAHLTMVDSELLGGSADNCAIKAEFGQYYFRNIKTGGYGLSLATMNNRFLPSELPYEIFSFQEFSLFNRPDPKSFDTANLPQEPVFNGDESGFVSVAQFGAVGNGVTDDTAAIQKAMNSGAAGVAFEAGCYLITAPVTVPEQVCTVNFMFCNLKVGPKLAQSGGAAFKIIGSNNPIKICNLLAWESFHGKMTLLDHAGTRTAVLELLHTQGAALYQNSVPGGTVFVTSCACTVGGVPGAGGRKTALAHEDEWIDARETPCFYFNRQTVYARQINPERAKTEIINNGGRLFVLGFKTEEEGTAFFTQNGGVTQVLGGVCCIGAGKPVPLVFNQNAHSLIVLTTMVNNNRQRFPVAVLEEQNGSTRALKEGELPVRTQLSYSITKYSS